MSVETAAEDFRHLTAQLTLEEKVLLLTGQDFWSTHALPKIGLRSIVFSDGPAGVRGPVWDERAPSLSLPSGTALSASWSRRRAYEYGRIAAAEARRKGVDVVLGPTINMHRSPLGGRHFEAFSEDPLLTSVLASSYVSGLQEHGVAATPKHYVANDFETDRFTANVVVSERALREVYLYAFEKAVTEAGAWALMTAYNSVNGSTATESELVERPLNEEWGFDGVAVSDWTAVRSIDSAKHAQDLAMPGPHGAWGDALVSAVRQGDVEEAAIDRKIGRILLLAHRIGALGHSRPMPVTVTDEAARSFTRSAASAGMVLLKNDGVLPVAAGEIAKIAVIGHNASDARIMGGGSATVVPDAVVSPLDGLREAFPDAEIAYELGAVVQQGVSPLNLAELTNPVTAGPGLHLRFLDESGVELYAEERFSTSLFWFGGDAPIGQTATLELATTWTPAFDGAVNFGFASTGHATIRVNGETLIDSQAVPVGSDLGAAILAPPSVTRRLDVHRGVPLDITIEYRRVQMETGLGEGLSGIMGFTFGSEPFVQSDEQLIADAARVAADSDLVVLFVGTNSQVESEGFDRTSLRLPGRQDDLARAVIDANPRTIVVVNAGAPVEMPWRDRAAGILLAWFGGQETGHAIADVLTGIAEPGGRLPTTWPKSAEDVPVIDVTPRGGIIRYDEGIHIGYRAWLKAAVEPAYPFGYGLGYTTWRIDGVRAPGSIDPGDALVVEVDVTNTGHRMGAHIVQVYASRIDSSVERPARWLIGFADVILEAVISTTVAVEIEPRAFAHWDSGWQFESGDFQLFIGSSVNDIDVTTSIRVTSGRRDVPPSPTGNDN